MSVTSGSPGGGSSGAGGPSAGPPGGASQPGQPGQQAPASSSPPHPGPALWVATAGGVGFGPWAPGTWGALVAVVVFALALHRLGPALYGVLVVAVSAIGVWASGAVEAWFGRHDDGRIVIDEVAGQLVTLAPIVALHGVPLGVIRVPGLASLPGGGIDAWWLLVVTGFVAFRWFDIRKPGPVKWAEERFEGGAGVMADDLVAGVLGAVVVVVPAYVLVVSRLRALVVEAAWLDPARAIAEVFLA